MIKPKQLLSSARLFSDDSSLFYAEANIADIAGIINHGLQMVLNWARQWLVTFNLLIYLLLKSQISFHILFLIILQLVL